MRHSIGYYLEAAGGAEGRKDNFLWIRLVAATLVIYGHGFALAALGSGQRDFFTQYLNYRYSGDVAVAVFFVISEFWSLAAWSEASPSFGLHWHARSACSRVYGHACLSVPW